MMMEIEESGCANDSYASQDEQKAKNANTRVFGFNCVEAVKSAASNCC
jgi:hypothetical protein